VWIWESLDVEQFFVLIDENFIDIETFFADGVLGLGFSQLSSGYSNFIETLKIKGAIDHAMFSLYLSSKGDDVEDAIHSNLILGGYDLEKYSWETQLTYLNISNTSGYWEVPLTAVHFDTGLDIEAKSVTFDIGTSMILASFLDHSTIRDAFRFYTGCAEDADNYIYCDCPFQNFTKSYPDLTFFLGAAGIEFRVSPYHYFYWNETTQLCLLLIGENTGENWVLGDVFLREYYTV